MRTIAFVTIDGTGMVNEPIVEIHAYWVNEFAAGRKWGPFVQVEFTDGSELRVFADEISVEVLPID